MRDFNNPIDESIFQLFSEYRTKYNITETVNVAVMVSGGLDSIALAHTLNSIKKELNVILRFVYVNFKDFPEYEVTKKFVVEFSERYGVPLMIYDPKDYIASKTSAREAMKSAGMSVNADIILTGHHADDQIETFLFRAFRGSGVEGLCAMKPLSEFVNPSTKKTHIFGKPFLSLFKSEIDEWTYKSLHYIKDSSNKENGPDRNFIRNEVVSKISERFDKRNILNTIQAINEYVEVTNLEDSDRFLNSEAFSWAIDDLLSVPVLNRVFLIRRHLSKMWGHNLNRKSVKALKKVMESDWTELNHNLTDKLTLIRHDDWITIKTNSQET